MEHKSENIRQQLETQNDAVKSVLLYGVETWGWKEYEDIKKT